jgi:isoleucyl-tRNA synthetase
MVEQMHQMADARRARRKVSSGDEADYKNTVNPQTEFAMKGICASRTADARVVGVEYSANCAGWQRTAALRAARRSPWPMAPSTGHACNDTKDIIVKSRTLDGYDSPYIPGWDCHGLPIEMQWRRSTAASGRGSMRALSVRPAAPMQEQIDRSAGDFSAWA